MMKTQLHKRNVANVPSRMYIVIHIPASSFPCLHSERFKVFMTLRCAGEDTVLTTTSHATGEDVVLPVPKGTKIAISITGVHYNRE